MQTIAQFLNLATLELEADLAPAPRRERKAFNQNERDGRAADLLASRILVGYGSTYFMQPADPAANPYTIDLHANTCTCPDHRFRVTRERLAGNMSAVCKHVTACRLYVSNAHAAAAK